MKETIGRVAPGWQATNRRVLRWKGPEAAWGDLQAALGGPHTLLEYLLALALAGILIAAALIAGVQLHLVHRLL